ncbi:MAG TPA: SCO family protein [Solirubrobacteraceae bacterium]|nr:SCO family protein [Solirubrobacteraceae bacterium]
MHPRLRLTLMLVATIAIATAAAVVLLVGPGGGAGATTRGFAGSVRPDVPTRDFALRDQDGRLVRLSALRGRPVVVTFLYTVCRDTCPLMADQIRGALDRLGGPPPPVLAVSVDPRNDTPARAARFVARHGLTGRMDYLLGTSAQLQPVWRQFGIQPQTGGTALSDHSAYVVLLDRRLRQRVAFPISELTPEALAHDIRRLES